MLVPDQSCLWITHVKLIIVCHLTVWLNGDTHAPVHLSIPFFQQLIVRAENRECQRHVCQLTAPIFVVIRAIIQHIVFGIEADFKGCA